MARKVIIWTLVVNLVLLNQLVIARPQDSEASSNDVENSTELQNRVAENKEKISEASPSTQQPRDVKTKSAPLGESIKMVASQLLENPNATSPTPIVTDTRIPPKLKNQLTFKTKTKTRLEDTEIKEEHSHAGVAVPVTMDDIETEKKDINHTHESSTTLEGISTWILLSNPTAKETVVSTEPTKIEEVHKKPKPNNNKNKKRPTNDSKVPPLRHPIIGSINKSDLVAGGSALNDNVLNKIKDTVLSNVQKHKTTAGHKSTTEASTQAITDDFSSFKKESTKIPSTTAPVIKVSSKPPKKKTSAKNKYKITSTTEAASASESALLPMEPKEQEIELEISTPATTTQKPKRLSNKKKKNKTKKRKTSPPKQVAETAIELKSSNKTKSAKPAKTPESPITTQIYNYLSREVMPSVGVGVIGLAGLVGIASYFFYPFATPVRRTFEVDKKDDLYRHNGEEYANDGNGQAEEEMLGTVLAGMPAHTKNRLNPYMGQTAHTNTYAAKKEQDLRYRHVTSNYATPNQNIHYSQQKTGIAHGAAFADHIGYNPHKLKHENRFVYTTEGKYAYEKSSYTPYPAVEPIYAAPSEAADISRYGSDIVNSAVYGVKPSAESDFKPVYPFEGQVFSDTTSFPATYPSTSMYLGSNNESEQNEDVKIGIENKSDRSSDLSNLNQFVVGNVPKEFVDTVTPAIVPEHGPRNLNRRKRFSSRIKRNVIETIEQVLKDSKLNGKDVFLSNEIDEVVNSYKKNTANKIEHSVLTSYMYPDEKLQAPKIETLMPENLKATEQVVESVSTLPVEIKTSVKTTDTKSEKLIETITTPRQLLSTEETILNEVGTENSDNFSDTKKEDETTTLFSERITDISKVTDTTTDSSALLTSTYLPTSPSLPEIKLPGETSPSTLKPKPANPNVITYPPISEEGSFFTFLRRLLDFKYRLGLSILQTTSDSLNRYLRNMENAANNATGSLNRTHS